MDGDSSGRPRNIELASETQKNISERDKRWSMNSQRLEEIVAELMKPIGDYRRSFDTDLSALLEEYLTEAGLHALDAEEEGVPTVVPNFAELALLLQQSASIYSRKVDFLYQHVLNVSDSLQQSTQQARSAAGEAAGEVGEAAGEVGEAGARRKRKPSSPEGFAALALEASGAARREAGASRPPPTLPRMFVELEPRVLAAGDAPLHDYAGEPVGLLQDFHVAWRLQEGFLVEELSRAPEAGAALRPLALSELSAAVTAAAPPSPVPRGSAPPSPAPSESPPDEPPPDETPPVEPPSPPVAASTPLPPDRPDRKRRRETRPDDEFDGCVKLYLTQEAARALRVEREFSVPEAWARRVLRARCGAVRAARGHLRLDELRHDSAFRGFDASSSMDGGGFAGWSGEERAAAAAAGAARRPDDSDDDGFFEQSSLGESDGSRGDDGPRPWVGWCDAVLARAAANETRGLDVRRAAERLLAAARGLPPGPRFAALLARVASHPAQVSELFLATLFLANAGNVQIVPGAPLAVGDFAVRLVSSDQRLYRAAALADVPPR